MCGNSGCAEALSAWLANWQPAPPRPSKRAKRADRDPDDSEEELAWSDVRAAPPGWLLVLCLGLHAFDEMTGLSIGRAGWNAMRHG